MILAIDTSTDQGSVALSADSIVLAELSWSVNSNHSRHLSRNVKQLLELENRQPRDLRSVVVASGPGSFSGLRVGISAAKGIAMALDIPLAGVSTLDVIGFQACHISTRVRAFMPAGRGQVYSASYEGNPDTFTRIGEYELMTLDDAARGIDANDLVAGPGGADVIKAIEYGSSEPRLEPEALRMRRAGFLAELGRRYFVVQGANQIDGLEPLYLRRSAAEDKLAGGTR